MRNRSRNQTRRVGDVGTTPGHQPGTAQALATSPARVRCRAANEDPITCQYIGIDMAMKRKAIERCPPLVPDPEGESRWHVNKDIIQRLEDL